MSDQSSLRGIVRNQFLAAFQSCADKFPGWMVLVVDPPAMRVLTNALNLYELAERRITLVESILKKRAPFPDMAVIYLVSPTVENMNMIIADCNGTGTLKKKPLYGDSVFIYTLSGISNSCFDKIKSSNKLMKSIKGLVEVNVDFLAKENCVFHLDMKSCFAEMFTRSNAVAGDQITSKLVTVCAALNEYPHIRYQGDSPKCEVMANTLLTKINAFVGASPNWWYHGMPGHEARDRSTLLIIDRSEDPLTPLMHDFRYQAMVHDLLSIDNDCITVDESDGGKKEVLLNMEDDIWVELKAKHIAEVSEILGNRLKDFLQNDSAHSFQKKSNMSAAEMGRVLRELPEYRESLSKLSHHFKIAQDCLALFTKSGLLEVSELEQTIATGKDAHGKSVKRKQIEKLLEESLPNLQPELAMRLLGIFICSQNGISVDTRDKLFDLSPLSADQKNTILNLENLGVTIDSDEGKAISKRGFFERFRAASKANLIVNKRQNNEESEYNDRYVCLLKTILEDMVQEKLDIEEYPSVLPLPVSDGGIATTARKKKTKKGAVKVFTGPRKLVFVAGGLGYSEICAAEEIMSTSDREIILGGTSFLSATDYVEKLKSLS